MPVKLRALALFLPALFTINYSALSQSLPQNVNSVIGGLRIKKVSQTIDVKSDGRTTLLTDTDVQILGGAAAAISQIPINYNAALQTAEVISAYTYKANGQKVPVDPGNIVSQKSPSVDLSPIYNDREQKIIIFPDVEVGDELVFKTRLTDKEPLIPGQFTVSRAFPSGLPADEVNYSLTVPRDMVLNIETVGLVQSSTIGPVQKTYTWSKSNSVEIQSAGTGATPPSGDIRFTASTFGDYEQLSHYLAPRMLGSVRATVAVQKQANEITAGINGKREQAKALYDWVNQHVRYVAIELGAGAITPHEPDWTLTNAFGDCKDQAVLYMSLLKAKGIESNLALISANVRYTVEKVPTVGEFNHVIVWLPELSLYTDTTAAGVPFGQLPMLDYGKPVVHITRTGSVTNRTPLIMPGAINSTYKVHAVMNKDGAFDVDVSMTASGFWASALRKLASDIQVIGPADAAGQVLRARGFAAASGTLQTPPEVGSDDYTIIGKFHTERSPPGLNVLTLADALRLVSRVGDGPMGSINSTVNKSGAEGVCYSAHQIEDVQIELSDGQRFDPPPADVHVRAEHFSYDTHVEVNRNILLLRREFLSKIKQPVCTAAMQSENVSALGKIKKDYDRPVRFAQQ